MTLASGIVLPAEKIAEICRKYQVRELAVFGLAARGVKRRFWMTSFAAPTPSLRFASACN